MLYVFIFVFTDALNLVQGHVRKHSKMDLYVRMGSDSE